MSRLLVIFLAVTVLATGKAFSQTSPSTASGLELLQRVSQRYAEAKSYHLEAVEERTSSNDLRRCWEKTVMVAAEAPGGRYRYEGHSGMGSALRVSDGKTVWTYHMDARRYTQKSVTAEKSSRPRILGMEEMPLLAAENLHQRLADFAKHLKSATRMPDATLDVNGLQVACYVVRVESADMKRPGAGASSETYWIDKANDTIVRTVAEEHTYLMAGAGRVPLQLSTTTAYTEVDLGTPARKDMFAFVAPPDAKLVENFPNPMSGGLDLSGEQAPAVTLKSADGKQVSLASFRGRPVLLDVWATWCAPCVEALQQLARLYAQAKDTGLTVISVDQDEEAKTATDFLAKHDYTWTNFHDDGTSLKALNGSGIPRALLIDEQGKIVFDQTGFDEQQLRAALAKLGPQYAFLAAQLPPEPCAAAKQ